MARVARIPCDEIKAGSGIPIYTCGGFDSLELIMVSEFKTRKLAQQVLHRLPESRFSSSKLIPLKLPGKGTTKTYVVRPEDAVDFVNALPPMKDEENRGKMINILQRWLENGGAREGSPGIEASSVPFGPVDRVQEEAGSGSAEGSAEGGEVPMAVEEDEEEVNGVGGEPAAGGSRAVGSLLLDQLFPGKSVTVFPGQRVDAVEMDMVFGGRDRHGSLRTLRHLPDENFKKTKFVLLKIPGPGNNKTYTVHFRDVPELLMALPGRMMQQIRREFANLILRYFAGDASLGPEIEANAASDHPIHRAARAALDEERVSSGEKRVRELEETLLKANEACGVLEKRAKTLSGEMQRQCEEAEGLAEVFKFAYEQVRGIRQEKEQTWTRDEQGRERLMKDLEKQDELETKMRANKLRDEELSRAKANEAIFAETQAKIQAMNLLADTEASLEAAKKARAAAPPAPVAPPAPPPPAQPAPPPPAPQEPYADVACFLPDDCTTVRKTYNDTFPKFKPKLRKDEGKFLNEAQTRVRQAYQAAHGGARPRRVREERHIVDMYPTVWGGVLETLTAMQREAVGFGQQTLHSFVHHVVHHNRAPRVRFGPMQM
jgi:hypothetical protein